MKFYGKYILTLMMIGISFTPCLSIDAICTNIISKASLTRHDAFMSVDMTFDFSKLKLKKQQGIVFLPQLINGTDTLSLPEVGVFGRNRWFKMQRDDNFPQEGKDANIFRYKKGMEDFNYHTEIEYSDWMNGSNLILKEIEFGCANCKVQSESRKQIAVFNEVDNTYKPVFYYKEAIAETVKSRQVSGRAYVDFPINQTAIIPDYRRNSFELAKILATIDSIKNDKDISVSSLSIKGFASPDGPYDINAALARGRTEALKDYVDRLYHFPTGFISTSFEAEDWEGLKDWVTNSNIENRQQILEIINSGLEPDLKNSIIQTSYPVQYNYLLQNVYPYLRHSDYKIEYTIRQFTDIDEIAEIFNTSPQKLSLSEMYTLAASYPSGSDDYNEVFETAVRMFPDDEIANLNAANSEMNKGNLKLAARYLAKAGNSAEAVYARGVLAALQGNRYMAEELLREAYMLGFLDAGAALENLRNSKIPEINYKPEINNK